jgi:hypothetical protein
MRVGRAGLFAAALVCATLASSRASRATDEVTPLASVPVIHRVALGRAEPAAPPVLSEVEYASRWRGAGFSGVYLPPKVARSEVFALARRDLERSFEYVSALQQANAPSGFLAFTALPARLADQALTAIEQRGPGAKVPRAEVASLMERLQADLAAGRMLTVSA